jgi:hypothetical protein
VLAMLNFRCLGAATVLNFVGIVGETVAPGRLSPDLTKSSSSAACGDRGRDRDSRHAHRAMAESGSRVVYARCPAGR